VKKRLLLLDNKDSFTYNLVESFRRIPNVDFEVLTPSGFNKKEIHAPYDGMIVSPGPGLPTDSTALLKILNDYLGKIPILGVCLGLQALLVNEGVSLRQMDKPLHGQSSILKILDSKDLLYREFIPPIVIGHYHSWYALPEDCPSCYIPTAIDSAGRLMSMRHKIEPVWAVQFHPESYLCPQGDKLIANFLQSL
jgi:anthranilate synthase component 2